MLTAFTRNLGYRRSGDAWLRTLLNSDEAPDLVFAQEVPPSLLDNAPPGFEVVTVGRAAERSAVGRTSALFIRDGAGDLDLPDGRHFFPSLGTYVATARLKLDGRPIWLVSVHTSPTPVPVEKRRPDFGTRTCETEPWWSDAFVAELAVFASDDIGDAVIAGDLNQAREYDRATGHVCGGELLDAIEATGFVDVTRRDSGDVERPTRLNPAYHLDRVWASSSFAQRVRVDEADLLHDDASDHAAVKFSLSV